jgi:hypothetical protein
MEEGDPSAEKVLIFSIRGHLVYKSLEWFTRNFMLEVNIEIYLNQQ